MIQKLVRLLFCLVPFFMATIAFSASNSINKIDAGLVKLYVLTKENTVYTGTGFVVGKDGLVATNYHVIENAVELMARRKLPNKDIKKYKVNILASNPALDVALLRVEGLEAEPLEISTVLPVKGDKVFAIGFPVVANHLVGKEKIAEGILESTLTEGVVGRVFQGSWNKGAPELPIIQHSAPINGGNSGGPLVDRCGAVIGINTGSLKSIGRLVSSNVVVAEQNQGIFYASSITEIIPELKSRNVLVSEDKSEKNCIPFGNSIGADSQNSKSGFMFYGIVLVAITSIILIGFAIYFFTRKPTVVSESYTHYVRRTGNKILKHPVREESPVEYKLCLTLQNGQSKRVKLALGKSYIFGRDPNQCQIVVDDPSVSRKHAQIKATVDGLEIRDLESTNGTFINSARISGSFKPAHITDNMLIGKVRIRIDRV